MSRIVPLLAVLVVACAQGQAPFTSPDIKEPARADVLVQVGNSSVDPAVARVKEGGSVAWTNDSDYMVVVSFPGADASKFQCKELRPNFSKNGDTVESLPFVAGAVRVVLPCALKKGSYPYTIKLVSDISQMDNPKFTLAAQIVVE
ncbi:MAG TPA: hypothetical protein DEP35_24835 [Deltaproteobacteria bacterium]|jgi:hypothetical protein|nr:hypothetical protein [Deltaproteobacteria bacterium]